MKEPQEQWEPNVPASPFQPGKCNTKMSDDRNFT